jgi:hypothetical protein
VGTRTGTCEICKINSTIFFKSLFIFRHSLCNTGFGLKTSWIHYNWLAEAGTQYQHHSPAPPKSMCCTWCSLVENCHMGNGFPVILLWLVHTHSCTCCSSKAHILCVSALSELNFINVEDLGFCLVGLEVTGRGVPRTHLHHHWHGCMSSILMIMGRWGRLQDA